MTMEARDEDEIVEVHHAHEDDVMTKCEVFTYWCWLNQVCCERW